MAKNVTYWVACSGGVDSVVLLHLMHKLYPSELGVLHCNFTLRGEDSNADETFVRSLAKGLNIPIRVRKFNTIQYGQDNRINTQLAARELRYDWFNEIIETEKGTVFLAHHYDDQIETFFLQLRRGGKVKGLAGMPIYRNGYLRPLLNHRKTDLIALAKKNNWKWREDVSNSKNDYTRNWYRNEVLNQLEKSGFPMSDVVSLVHCFQHVLSFIDIVKVENEILISEWLSLPVWIKNHFLSTHKIGEYSSQEIDRLAHSSKGRFIANAYTKVWNEGKTLYFKDKAVKDVIYDLITTEIPIDELIMNPNDLFLDAAKVNGELTVRKWKSGDRFQPLGMKGEKALGKFLRDRKVAAHLKESVLVLVDEGQRVLGVFGFGVNERFKINSETHTVLKLSLKGND